MPGPPAKPEIQAQAQPGNLAKDQLHTKEQTQMDKQEQTPAQTPAAPSSDWETSSGGGEVGALLAKKAIE